ncbi:MAG: tetratricopeptide repeat protein, partial [Bacteroidota bacterium]
MKFYSEKLLALAEQIDDNFYVASATLLLGEFYFTKSRYSRALEYYRRSMDAYQAIEDQAGVAEVLRVMGGVYHEQGKLDQTLKNYRQSLAIWETLEDRVQLAVTLINLTNANIEVEDYEQALIYLTRALETSQAGDPPGTRGMLFNSAATYYSTQGDYAKSLDYYFQCLKINEERNNQEGIAATLFNISIVYENQEKLEQALQYNLRVLEIAENHDIPILQALSLNRVAGLYKDQQNYEAALEYAERGLKANQKFGLQRGVAFAMGLMGQIYYGLDEDRQALKYLQMGLDVEGLSNSMLAYLHGNMAEIYHESANLPLALYHGQKALASVESGTGEESLGYRSQAAKRLYQIYDDLNKPVKALRMYEFHIQNRDSLEQLKNTKENQRATFQFEYERKSLQDSLAFVQQQAETELSYQKQLAQRNYLLFGSLGLALILGLAFYFWQQRRSREKEITHQKEMLNSTILTQENERQRIAKDLHDSVGSKLSVMNLFLHQLTRRSPEAKDELDDMLGVVGDTIQTTRRISYDLLPPTLASFGLAQAVEELGEQLAQADGPAINVETEGERLKNLDPLIELNLFRVVQELLNNTLKYARAQSVNIRLVQGPDKLILQYEDDGRGFDPASSLNQKGLGMQNIRSRLQMIEGKMDLQSAPGQGVRV